MRNKFSPTRTRGPSFRPARTQGRPLGLVAPVGPRLLRDGLSVPGVQEPFHRRSEPPPARVADGVDLLRVVVGRVGRRLPDVVVRVVPIPLGEFPTIT